MTCEQNSYGGMHNVYATKYKKEYGYCADSTGFWRYEILQQRISEAKDNVLQVLIHDAMWQDRVLPPRRRVYRTIDEHASFMKKVMMKHFLNLVQKILTGKEKFKESVRSLEFFLYIVNRKLILIVYIIMNNE